MKYEFIVHSSSLHLWTRFVGEILNNHGIDFAIRSWVARGFSGLSYTVSIDFESVSDYNMFTIIYPDKHNLYKEAMELIKDYYLNGGTLVI